MSTFLQACKAVQDEFDEQYSSPNEIIGAMSARIVIMRDDLQHIKDNQKREYDQSAARKARGKIDGVCQELVEEMSWWAENEAHTEDARDEIICTIKYLLKKIQDVELTEAEPEGSDLAYETRKDLQICGEV